MQIKATENRSATSEFAQAADSNGTDGGEGSEPLDHRVLSNAPTDFDGLHLVAQQLMRRGALQEALARCDRAIAIKPGDAAALNTRGQILHMLGRNEEALTSYAKALATQPDFPQLWYNRGVVLAQMGRQNEALLNYEKALALHPDFPEALLNYGLALSVAGRPEEALQSYEKALAIKPDFLTVLNNRGAVLQRLGRHAEAMQSYDRVLAIDPDYADAHNNRGALLRDLGRLDEARESCARAIELRPSYPKFYLNFAYCHKFTSVDAHLSAMESMSCEASLSPDEQVELRFAVAKAYSDINEHQRSFAHLLEANRLKRQHVIYDERSALASFRHIRSAFSADMMRRKSGGGGSSTLPIFVVGMPRSGTSLVEQILASHSKVFGAGELPFFDSIARRTLAAVGGFPQGAPAATVDHLQKIGAEYIGRLRALAPPEITRIVDKMPGNFHHVGLIHLALPHARIVHARRSPADTCFSCFATLFAAPHPYSYDLGELASYYAAYQELMQHWRSVLPDGVMLEVEYETLVANFEEQSRRLLAHCGLEWQPACLDFYKTERLVHTASATQVRQPIYSTSIGRWRPYQQWLDPLLQGLQIAGLH